MTLLGAVCEHSKLVAKYNRAASKQAAREWAWVRQKSFHVSYNDDQSSPCIYNAHFRITNKFPTKYAIRTSHQDRFERGSFSNHPPREATAAQRHQLTCTRFYIQFCRSVCPWLSVALSVCLLCPCLIIRKRDSFDWLQWYTIIYKYNIGILAVGIAVGLGSVTRVYSGTFV